MKRYFLLLLALHIIGPVCISQEVMHADLRSIPLLKRFESADYNGGIQSWDIDQDSAGYLYVANNNGLLEFDGSRWTRYEVPSSTKLRAVHVDDNNRIFVGGQGQIGYFELAKHGISYRSLMAFLPDNYKEIAETWNILEHDNKIYFHTESKLLIYDGSKIDMLEMPGYIQHVFKVKDQIWVQFFNLGMYMLDGTNFNAIEGLEQIPEIIFIQPENNLFYLFSKPGTVYTLSSGNFRKVDLASSFGTINSCLLMSSGRYILGTQNDGLFILNRDFSIYQHLTKNAGLSDRTVRALHEDQFNNLWVALNNGIDYLELSLPFSIINDKLGLEGTGYAACSFKGTIYLGTNNGLFVMDQQSFSNTSSPYKLVTGSEGQVYHFSEIGDDLILNHDRGAFMVNESALFQFHDIGSWKFVQTKNPDLIIGGDYTGLAFYRKAAQSWSNISYVPDFNESSRMMEFEGDSVLWMTHGLKGAYRFRFNGSMDQVREIEFYGQNGGFPSNNMISVYKLNNNLVFTAETGVYNYDQESDSFMPNPFFETWLGEEHVSAMASGDDDAIYFIQNRGAGVLKEESFGNYLKETALFEHINMLISDDLPNISVINDHHILFGAKEGFIDYNPKKAFSNNEDFEVLLKMVEVNYSNDSVVSYSPAFLEDFKISRTNAIKFTYASPFFDGFEKLMYSYRLLPDEESWTKWSASGEKEYTYLPAGEYTFEVKAMNVYGDESPLSSFSFLVFKPWYFSELAIIAYIFLALVLVAIIMSLQRRRFKEEKDIITQDKEHTLRIKDEEISQLSINSKKEIERLQNEKLRTEVDLKNEQLTTITMNLMNNNGLIQEALKNIETKLDKGGSKDELKRIIRSIEKNLSNNDTWDQFAYHFDQVHGDYLKKLSMNNIRLSPREIKLAAFLRMNLSSKEISKMMNITSRSVELARHRLRKKLKLKRDQNLVEFLIDLDNK